MTDSSLNIYVLESIELELESIKELWGDAINENDKLTNEIGKLKRRIAELENAQLKSPHTQSMTAAPVAMFTLYAIPLRVWRASTSSSNMATGNAVPIGST